MSGKNINDNFINVLLKDKFVIIFEIERTLLRKIYKKNLNVI